MISLQTQIVKIKLVSKIKFICFVKHSFDNFDNLQNRIMGHRVIRFVELLKLNFDKSLAFLSNY